MTEEDEAAEAADELQPEAPPPDDNDIEVDLRHTPEYKRARGSIFAIALLFYGFLAVMCIIVAVIVVILLTGS